MMNFHTFSGKKSWVWLALLSVGLFQCNTFSAAPPPTPTVIAIEESVSDLYAGKETLAAGEKTDIQVGVVKVVGSKEPIDYLWSTTGGVIAQGQGTCCVTYQAPETPGAYEVLVTIQQGEQLVQRRLAFEVTEATENSGVAVDPTATPTLVSAVPTATVEATEEPLESAEDYFERAQVNYRQRNFDQTIADYTEAIERGYEPLYEPYYNRGYAYYVQREYELAVDDFGKAIELEYEPLSLPYYNRANAYYYQGNSKKAVEDYTKAIEMNHDPLSWIYNNRGLAYRKMEEYEKAIEDYTTAIELEHEPLHWPYFNRGNAYADKEMYDLALADYNETLRLEPNNIDAHFQRGLVYKELDQISLARSDFNEVLRLGQDDDFWRREAEEQLEELTGE